ncbi:MAG TPA: anthranilate synthase component I [bacterium]
MIYPSFREFKALSGRGNLIPVYTELLADLETPLSAYMKVGNTTNSFLLESVEGGERWARYSFIGSDPDRIFVADKDSARIYENGKKIREDRTSDPIMLLEEIMKGYVPVIPENLPYFTGGAVGYIGYDWAKRLENIPDASTDRLFLPEAVFVITDTILVFDNVRHKIIAIANAFLKDEPVAKAYSNAVKKLEKILKGLKKPLQYKFKKTSASRQSAFTSNFNKKQFVKIVEKTKKYIEEGEIIQAVLSQRFESNIKTEPLDVYRALRIINPSPYMYYLNFKDAIMAGSSPEILVRLNGKDMTLRPIAGTRPRRGNADEDKRLSEELISDPKERAEHIMLVDLGRNDLGRVAEPGSVRISELMSVEKYSHVMHLVSTVTGRIQSEKNCFDLLRASFPAGTVTGAPKIRAMQIIESLEKTKRGPYAGAVGYFGFNGNMDMAITLRTVLFSGGKVRIQAGAGIVYDSVPEREYEETVNKAMGMKKAVEMAGSKLMNA